MSYSTKSSEEAKKKKEKRKRRFHLDGVKELITKKKKFPRSLNWHETASREAKTSLDKIN